jgi:spore germination protein Q
MQQSYIENILRMNLEKVATVYMTFEHEGGAQSKAFRGEIEAAGRDHVIINDNKTGTRYLLPLIYLDYVTFQGPINYSYPFA